MAASHPLHLVALTFKPMGAPKIPFLLDRRMLAYGVQWWIDIDLAMPGVLIVGPSGWGKSTASASLVGTLAILYPDVRVWVMDGKGDPAFRFLHDVPGARYYPYRAALDGLRELNQILQDRMAGTIPLSPFCFGWLDELMGLLLLLPKKEQEEVRGMVTSILLQGRAMGVQLLLSVQRPDASMFASGGAARESLNHTLVLGPMSASMASMVGDVDTAQLMPIPAGTVGAGHLLTAGNNLRAVQVPMVRDWNKLEQAVIHAVTN